MLTIDTGAYCFRLESDLEHVKKMVTMMYGHQEDHNQIKPADYKIRIKFDSFFRRFIKPQISFYSDCHLPFKPMPANQAFPVLEWGMNWCISAYDFNHLIIHAAVIEKDGQAIIFPATPGSGKSTLSAFMALSGWNLFSDEMAIIDLNSNRVSPLYRPVCLKNESITLVKEWFPNAIFTPVAKDTHKGDVAHLKTQDFSCFNQLNKAEIKAIVFPKYARDQDITIYQLNKSQGFSQLVQNAFNYNILGATAFDTVKKIIESSNQFEIIYNNLDDVSDLLINDILAI
ncbi:MAG: HprK-related kinase A [Halopseudomonas sp.]